MRLGKRTTQREMTDQTHARERPEALQPIFSESFGATLFRLRHDRGLLQSEAARRVGVSKGYYSAIENSKRCPPPEKTVRRIGAALRLTAAELSELATLADCERTGPLDDPLVVPPDVRALLIRLRKAGPNLSTAVVEAIATQLRRAEISSGQAFPAVSTAQEDAPLRTNNFA